MARLFFALQPKPDQQVAIAAALLPMVRALGARPTQGVDLHLTLAFLGEVPAEANPGLQRAAASAGSPLLDLRLARADFWQGARALCLLPEDDATQSLQPLVRTLADAALGAGIRLDDKPFRPHVTVARKVPPADLRRWQWPQTLPSPLPFTADGFVLMESTCKREGPRYRVIHAWPGASGAV